MRNIISFLIILLLIISCGGNQAGSIGSIPETAPEAEKEGVQRSQDRVNSVEKSIISSREKKKSHQNLITIENYSEKRFLMAGKSAPVVPDDFIIGKIADYGILKGSAEEAVAMFFEDYRRGKISKKPADYFLGENRTLLTMLFEEWYNSKVFPTDVRIGHGLISENGTKVTARCFMGNGDCICEFVMDTENGKWKVKSFSGNLEEMTEPAEKREEFEPEVYYFF